MEYILGIITGLLLALILLVVDVLFRAKINPQGILAQAEKKTKGKGEIIEGVSPEIESFINSLPSE